MGTHSFIVTTVANAPREKVWALFADGARWKDWAAVVKSSLEREGLPPPDGVGSIRRLGPPPFASREEVVVWEPPSHLGYVILSGMPVRNYRADIRLTESAGGAVGGAAVAGDASKVTTVIEWSATFDPKIPRTGALLKVGLGAILGRFAKRAARYAEKPSA
jgi:uncharacterized protein YndB with AHSA1/START domain